MVAPTTSTPRGEGYNQGAVDGYIQAHEGESGHDKDEAAIKDFGSDKGDLSSNPTDKNAQDHTLFDKLPKGLQTMLKKLGIDTDAEFKHGESAEGYGKDAKSKDDKKDDKSKTEKAPQTTSPDGRPDEGKTEHYGAENMGGTVKTEKDNKGTLDYTVTPDGKGEEPQPFKNVPKSVSGTDLIANANVPADGNGYKITDTGTKSSDPKTQQHLVTDKEGNAQVITGPVVSGDAPEKPVDGTTYLNKNGTTYKKDGDTVTYGTQDKDGKTVTMDSKDPLIKDKATPKEAEATLLAKVGKDPDGKPIAEATDTTKPPAVNTSVLMHTTSHDGSKHDIYVSTDQSGKVTLTDPTSGDQKILPDKPADIKALTTELETFEKEPRAT